MKRIIIAAVILLAAAAGTFFVSQPRNNPQEPTRGVVETLPPVVIITPTPSPTPEPAPEPTPPPPPIKLIVAGDVLTGEKIGPHIVADNYDKILDEVTAERFRNADVVMINLETAVSKRGTPIPDKAYTFRSPPENLAFLRDYLGVDIGSLANNHALDYGRDAFEDTLVHMREYGIEPIGGGMNLDEAAAPWIVEVGDVTIAFFASNQILPAVSWTATDSRSGQLVTRDPSNLGILEKNIRTAVEECDYVIVYMHWGIELDRRPNDMQKRTAHALADMGVDIVIGSHPHVIQSLEYYNDTPIIYSLGNFIFNSRNPETAYMEVTLDNGEMTIQLIPCKMNAQLTYPVDGEAAAELLAKWTDLSIKARLDESGFLLPTE